MYISFLQLVLLDPCGALTLAAVVLVIGHSAVGHDERVRRIGAALGGAVFLATIWLGIARRGDPLALAVCSLAWAGLTVGATWIVLAILAVPCRWVKKSLQDARHRREQRAADRKRAAEEAERREADRRRQEELAAWRESERQRAAASARPEPTRQERIAEAKRQYEETLRTLEQAGLDDAELQAARERAKQKYLRELDRWMA